jgi:hypothetical protein
MKWIYALVLGFVVGPDKPNNDGGGNQQGECACEYRKKHVRVCHGRLVPRLQVYAVNGDARVRRPRAFLPVKFWRRPRKMTAAEIAEDLIGEDRVC